MKPLRGWISPFVAGVMAVLLALVGCKGSDKPKVAFVSNNNADFWKIAEAGAKKAAKEFDVELLFRMPATGDAPAQKEEIDTVINQVKAIAVSVIDPKNQTDSLNEIAEKVHLLTVDNDAPKSKRLAYIGTDNYQAGRALGKLVQEAMPDGGNVVFFVGQLEPLNARQRRQGVIDELADRQPPKDLTNFIPSKDGVVHHKYKLYKETLTDQPQGAQKALENAQNILVQIPAEENLCMVGLWAYNPPQCLAAVKDKVKDKDRLQRIKIVGFDEDTATLEGIREGSVYATVVQDPYKFGYDSVKTMASLIKGQNLATEQNRYVPHRVITREAGEKNGLQRLAVDVFQKELNRLLSTR